MSRNKKRRGLKLRWPGILTIGALIGLGGGLLISEARVSAANDRADELQAQVEQLTLTNVQSFPGTIYR